ncbi:hypothetical protein ADK55_16045 [Streptomyces sp. WM4235]|uniref:hypothetical protein n=1 Tax=unclassified Streptomyces TaxID=2593676 RepID=UPI0006AE0C9B|nr:MULTISPECIES: hypothetical protein [unclassified Streptomyces]KOU52960.1 hypothetical protein ADK55_16045 [Streptomyces sp. WM4235]MCX5156248.1 hypothetical protein [Streptomyces sp. NBC_00291]
MRTQRILAMTAALACLAALPACEGDPAPGASGATPSAGAAATPVGGKGPAPVTLAGAQQYVRQFTNCDDLSDQPGDPRLPLTEFVGVGEWSVTQRGVCSDAAKDGQLVFYIPSDMKEFQERYKRSVMESSGGSQGLFSRVFVGKGFVVTPTSTESALALARSELRILYCNPSFWAPKGYKMDKALVEGCGLSDFVNAEDGKGSPNFETPQDPGGQKPGQPAKGSLGLARAGSVAELRKLVAPSVDCTRFSTDPDTVAIESIDYTPVVEGNALDWGVTGRALCGEPGGEQRAHHLNWLDTVGDMKALQTRAKAAQQADLKDDGKLRRTASRLLVGENVAVESNDPDVRFGLYQQQFLYLNCVPGFSAPTGYRLERARVEGCVLTNYDPENPVVGGN